jgi:hypothetical protein
MQMFGALAKFRARFPSYRAGRGTACNCQARLSYRGQTVIGLTLGRAC